MTDTDYAITYRLNRANHQSALLARLVTRYLKSATHRIENDFSSEPGFLLVRVRSSEPPPVVLSVIAGEALYHFRAALNYVACELVKYNKRQVNKFTEFPIFLERDDFRDSETGALTQRVKGKMGRMLPLHQTIIEQEQPFQGKFGRAEDDPLAVLHAMSDYDRHQFLHLTSTVTDLTAHSFSPPEAANRFEPAGIQHEDVEDGKVVARFRILSGPPVDVYVQSDVRFNVAFAEGGPGAGRPLVSTMGAIGVRIAEMLRLFTPWETTQD